MTDLELMQRAFNAMSYGNTDEREAVRIALLDRLAQPEPEPVAWQHRKPIVDSQGNTRGYSDWLPGRGLERWPHRRFYTTPPQRKPDYKSFMEWAGKEGYDTAYTVNSDNGKFMPLNPMTVDLWSAWQAAHDIKGEA